jgi:hypothetical protein
MSFGDSQVGVQGFNKERLCNLIRLLSTPIDGERLGAVHGIDRILKAAGLTFHDLASAVQRSSLTVDPMAQVSNSWIVAGREMLEAEGLAANERRFVEDMIRRYSSPSFVASEKQMNWFVSIYRRVVQGVERAAS